MGRGRRRRSSKRQSDRPSLSARRTQTSVTHTQPTSSEVASIGAPGSVRAEDATPSVQTTSDGTSPTLSRDQLASDILSVVGVGVFRRAAVARRDWASITAGFRTDALTRSQLIQLG